jgi:hypothetical protein
MAPELKHSSPEIVYLNYSSKCDVWSFGIVICELLHYGDKDQLLNMQNNIFDYLIRRK